MPSIAKGIRAATIVALMTGCSGASITSRATPPRGSVPSMPPPMPTPPTPPMPAPAASGGASRTICRTSGAPSGYVITDFVSSRTCESNAGRTYNAMLVEDISHSPVGTVTIICANQPLPRDWDLTGADIGVTSQCPREPNDRATSPAVTEIVRHRGGN